MRRMSVAPPIALLLLVGCLAFARMPDAHAVEDLGGGVFVPVPQARIVYATNWPQGSGAFGPGETRNYSVLGAAGVPATGVSAVVIELVARTTTATTSSYLTAWPTGVTRPIVSNLQYTQDNAPRSNTAIVKVGANGSISIYNYTGTTNVTVELSGYYTSTASSSDVGGFVAITPTRIANSAGTATGANVPQVQLPVGGYRDIQVAGVGPIGSSATSVFANVVVRDATTDGRIQTGPGGTTAINNMYTMTYGTEGPYDSGIAIKLNPSGSMRITNMLGAPVTFKIDVQGYFSGSPTEGSSFTAVSPAWIYGTSGGVALQPGEYREIPVLGYGNIPNLGVGAVAVTLTARQWSNTGTVTVYNADEIWPKTTTVSFDGDASSAASGNGITSTAMVQTSHQGTVMLHNTSAGSVGITMISQGWYSFSEELKPSPTATPEPDDPTVYADPDDPDAVYDGSPLDPEAVEAPLVTVPPGVNTQARIAGGSSPRASATYEDSPAECDLLANNAHISTSRGTVGWIKGNAVIKCAYAVPALEVKAALYRKRWWGWQHKGTDFRQKKLNRREWGGSAIWKGCDDDDRKWYTRANGWSDEATGVYYATASSVPIKIYPSTYGPCA